MSSPTPTRLPAGRPLAVEADLVLTIDGEDVQIDGRDDLVTIDLPSLRAGRTLLHSGPFATERVDRFRMVDWLLRDAGLTADVKLRGRQIARLGKAARPGRIARLLRLGQAEVYPGSVVTTSVQSSKGKTLALAGLAGLLLGLFIFRKR